MTHFGNSKQPKSKTALINAFNGLVLERPYAEFHVADIISVADVSRSTFYEHFGNKEDILRHCLTDVLGPLANAGFDQAEIDKICLVLDHFREFEEMAKIYLNGPVYGVVDSLLAEMIEARLSEQDCATNIDFPIGLLASQISSSTMGVIKSWLAMDDRFDSRRLAFQIQRVAVAIRLSADSEDHI